MPNHSATQSCRAMLDDRIHQFIKPKVKPIQACSPDNWWSLRKRVPITVVHPGRWPWCWSKHHEMKEAFQTNQTSHIFSQHVSINFIHTEYPDSLLHVWPNHSKPHQETTQMDRFWSSLGNPFSSYSLSIYCNNTTQRIYGCRKGV